MKCPFKSILLSNCDLIQEETEGSARKIEKEKEDNEIKKERNYEIEIISQGKKEKTGKVQEDYEFVQILG